MKHLLTLLLALCCTLPAHAEDAAIAALFAKAGVNGTLVIESTAGDRRFVHDDARAQMPFTPASTFKILNTLIAVEHGAITAEATIPWDGVAREMADWNRDQTLAGAFRVSCVWCYQLLAQRVGAAAYPAHIREAGYGTLREPFDVTQFWLDGSLTVSADQQVAFLRRLVARSLPYGANTYDTLRSVMLAEETPGYRLFAKTGWAARTTPRIGWYVGYVETHDGTWLFALNIDTRSAGDLPLRRLLVLEALRGKGLIPH
jgi:beta-lactamase class D